LSQTGAIGRAISVSGRAACALTSYHQVLTYRESSAGAPPKNVKATVWRRSMHHGSLHSMRLQLHLGARTNVQYELSELSNCNRLFSAAAAVDGAPITYDCASTKGLKEHEPGVLVLHRNGPLGCVVHLAAAGRHGPTLGHHLGPPGADVFKVAFYPLLAFCSKRTAGCPSRS
jgi:hypothetical protein